MNVSKCSFRSIGQICEKDSQMIDDGPYRPDTILDVRLDIKYGQLYIEFTIGSNILTQSKLASILEQLAYIPCQFPFAVVSQTILEYYYESNHDDFCYYNCKLNVTSNVLLHKLVYPYDGDVTTITAWDHHTQLPNVTLNLEMTQIPLPIYNKNIYNDCNINNRNDTNKTGYLKRKHQCVIGDCHYGYGTYYTDFDPAKWSLSIPTDIVQVQDVCDQLLNVISKYFNNESLSLYIRQQYSNASSKKKFFKNVKTERIYFYNSHYYDTEAKMQTVFIDWKNFNISGGDYMKFAHNEIRNWFDHMF